MLVGAVAQHAGHGIQCLSHPCHRLTQFLNVFGLNFQLFLSLGHVRDVCLFNALETGRDLYELLGDSILFLIERLGDRFQAWPNVLVQIPVQALQVGVHFLGQRRILTL